MDATTVAVVLGVIACILFCLWLIQVISSIRWKDAYATAKATAERLETERDAARKSNAQLHEDLKLYKSEHANVLASFDRAANERDTAKAELQRILDDTPTRGARGRFTPRVQA